MPEFAGTWNHSFEKTEMPHSSQKDQKQKKMTFWMSALFVAFTLLMKTCSVHPVGLGTISFGALRGLAEPWGAADSDLWAERPREGSLECESVPHRAFMAMLQSTIPFIYLFICLFIYFTPAGLSFLFLFFWIELQHKENVRLTSKALSTQQDSLWDLSVAGDAQLCGTPGPRGLFPPAPGCLQALVRLRDRGVSLELEPCTWQMRIRRREYIFPSGTEIFGSRWTPFVRLSIFPSVCLAGISLVSASNLLFKILLAAKNCGRSCLSTVPQSYTFSERKNPVRYHSWEPFLHPFLRKYLLFAAVQVSSYWISV